MMKQISYGFLLALQFLTRIPIPVQCPWNQSTSRWAIRSYPLVGAILGGVLTVLLVTLETFLPLSIMTLQLLSVWVLLTGGLHLDGVMDVADAVGSNASLEKKWEIMKDPHVGSFGLIALVFLLAWKAWLIYELLKSEFPVYSFIFIIACSRVGAVALLTFLPSAKQQGLAWEWKKHINFLDCLYGALPLLIGLVFFDEFLYLLPGYVVFLLLFGAWVICSFKGINGDLVGTAIEGGELWCLVLTWIYFSFVMG